MHVHAAATDARMHVPCAVSAVRAVCVRAPRVGVEVEQVLLATRGLQPAHAARALVERHPLLSRVAAVDALHVLVLGQVGRALVLADDVHAAMRALCRSAALGRRGGGGGGRGDSPRAAQREALEH